ncbi:unnamed protein product, partial [marine sediment metagenome]
KKPTSLSLTASPASGTPPFYTTLTATLTSNGTPLGYKEVEIYMRYTGIPWTKVTWGNTNASGVKSFIIHVGLTPLEFYARFAGDSEYQDCVSPTITITEEAPPLVDGRILVVYYWIEGMVSWENLEAYPIPAKVGDDIHLAVVWVNDGSSRVVGHVLAQLKSPGYIPYIPNAVEGQDHPADPGSGYTVEFAPVTLNERGSWEFFGRLTLDGTDIDSKKFTFTVEEAAVGIPTTLTIFAPDEVGPGETFNIFGQLTRDDTGVAIPAMSIIVSYNGNPLGSVLTDMQGVYTIPASIPDPGTYTLRADFARTPEYAASRSTADTIVAATPLEAALKIAGPAVTGLA